MKKQVIFAAVACLCSLVAACVGGSSNETLRYKMTVTVETPEGGKIGSAVREVERHTETSIIPEQGGVTYSVTKGEAVVVDLGARGIFFALLEGEREAKMLFQLLANNDVHKIVLNPGQYPRIVRFKNINDPTSAEIVIEVGRCTDPLTGIIDSTMCVTKNRFEEVLGKGVSLKSITVEESNEEITRTIRKYMPSYKNQETYMRWFNSLRYDDMRRINANDFGSVGAAP